jgi:SAM-dependent methyltransferase
MRRFNNSSRNVCLLAYRWAIPVVDPLRLLKAVPRYVEFLKDWATYSRLEGAERVKLINTHPCIDEKTQTASFDSHYFYQGIWAFKRIYASKPNHHVDVGSAVDFVGFLTAITKVTFIDIRPLLAPLNNFDSVKGSLLSLPLDDNSLLSLSCLHVAEHIGLGRYGDPLDPLGTEKACKELSRVLAPKGNLYFSVPVGRPRLCFNIHRIHSPGQIIDYFSDLELVELSGIDDKGRFIRDIDVSILESANYACGLFWFKKTCGL